MDMEIHSTLSEHWGIIKMGDLPGTSADGIPLAGSSRAPWLLGKPSAYAPQRPLRGVVLLTAGGTTMASANLAREAPEPALHHVHYTATPCPGSIRYGVADGEQG